MTTRHAGTTPLVGRFLMEDAIIPQQGVMRLDRFAYVMNNPVFYIDPSGYKACDEFDKNGKCIEDPQWHPRPDRLKVDELTTCKGKSDCVSGRDLYRFYLQLWHDPDGWWWSNGIFTIWDYMAILWSKEIASFVYGLHSGFHAYAEAMSRHAHDKQYNNCDPSQAECSLNFQAAYSQSAGTYYLTGSIDPSYPPTSYSHYLIAAIRDLWWTQKVGPKNGVA